MSGSGLSRAWRKRFASAALRLMLRCSSMICTARSRAACRKNSLSVSPTTAAAEASRSRSSSVSRSSRRLVFMSRSVRTPYGGVQDRQRSSHERARARGAWRAWGQLSAVAYRRRRRGAALRPADPGERRSVGRWCVRGSHSVPCVPLTGVGLSPTPVAATISGERSDMRISGSLEPGEASAGRLEALASWLDLSRVRIGPAFRITPIRWQAGGGRRWTRAATPRRDRTAPRAEDRRTCVDRSTA